LVEIEHQFRLLRNDQAEPNQAGENEKRREQPDANRNAGQKADAAAIAGEDVPRLLADVGNRRQRGGIQLQ